MAKTKKQKQNEVEKLLIDDFATHQLANVILGSIKHQYIDKDLQKVFERAFVQGFKWGYGIGLQDATDIFK